MPSSSASGQVPSCLPLSQYFLQVLSKLTGKQSRQHFSRQHFLPSMQRVNVILTILNDLKIKKDMHKRLVTMSKWSKQSSFCQSCNASLRCFPNSIVIYSQVIQTPNNMEALPGVGVWVQCLKKVRASRWTLEEKHFFVENINISRSLEYPSLTAAGSRLYYQFKL